MTSRPIIIIEGLIIVCHGLLTHAGFQFNFPTSVYVTFLLELPPGIRPSRLSDLSQN